MGVGVGVVWSVKCVACNGVAGDCGSDGVVFLLPFSLVVSNAVGGAASGGPAHPGPW